MTVHYVNRIDIVWLRCSPKFHFSDKEVADHLDCSERQVKAMVKQVRDSGLTFRKYDPEARKSWGPGIWKTRGNPEIGKKPDVRRQRFDGWRPNAKTALYELFRTQPEKTKDYLHLVDHQGYSDWCHEKHTAAYDPDLISDVHTPYERVGNSSGGNSSHSASASTNQVASTPDDEEASAFENASWKDDGTDKRLSPDREDEQILEYDFTDLDKPTIAKKGRKSRK
jgi:hypothetical protein